MEGDRAQTAGKGFQCRVCGSTDCIALGPPAWRKPGKVAGVPIDLSDQRPQYVRCNACKYEFIEPPVPQERLLECYRRSSGTHWPTDSTIAADRFYAHKRELLMRYAPGKRILDFGCYDGGFLEYLGESFDRAGIEPSSAAAQRAEGKGIAILGPTIDGIDVRKISPFDTIVVFDVMEHLIEPTQTLAALAALLKPGGIVLIETGNTDSPSFRKAGPRYGYVGIVEHVGFFNESSIRAAGEQAKLRLVHFETSQHAKIKWNPLTSRLVNMAYSALRVLRRVGIPLPERFGNIADGPLPRTMHLDDHFLAVLQRAG